MMQEGLAAWLEGDAGVSAITSRIFAIEAPDQGEVYPCLVYLCDGGEGAPILEDGGGMIRQRVQISALSLQAGEAMRLRYAATLALLQWRKQKLADGTYIDTTNLLDPASDYPPGAKRYFACVSEFYVFFTMPILTKGA